VLSIKLNIEIERVIERLGREVLWKKSSFLILSSLSIFLIFFLSLLLFYHV